MGTTSSSAEKRETPNSPDDLEETLRPDTSDNSAAHAHVENTVDEASGSTDGTLPDSSTVRNIHAVDGHVSDSATAVDTLLPDSTETCTLHPVIDQDSDTGCDSYLSNDHAPHDRTGNAESMPAENTSRHDVQPVSDEVPGNAESTPAQNTSAHAAQSISDEAPGSAESMPAENTSAHDAQTVRDEVLDTAESMLAENTSGPDAQSISDEAPGNAESMRAENTSSHDAQTVRDEVLGTAESMLAENTSGPDAQSASDAVPGSADSMLAENASGCEAQSLSDRMPGIGLLSADEAAGESLRAEELSVGREEEDVGSEDAFMHAATEPWGGLASLEEVLHSEALDSALCLETEPADRPVSMASSEASFGRCSVREPFRMTQELRVQIDGFRACPIDLEPMLDPVRLVHVDEDSRKGSPHVLGRTSAERWLKASGWQCPLCRGKVVWLEPDKQGEKDLASSIEGLAKQRFQGGDNILHKAVKLLDPQLFAAVGRLLDVEEIDSMVSQKNDQSQEPLQLLEALHTPSQCDEFLNGLPICRPDLGGPKIFNCPRAAVWGGSNLWCNEAPIFLGNNCSGADGSAYKVFYTHQTQELSNSDGNAEGVDELNVRLFEDFLPKYPQRWGTAVLLRSPPGFRNRRKEFCACPIINSFAPRSNGEFDEEVYEPALRIRASTRTEKVFHGRVACRRGLWIGSTEYFDDYIIPVGTGASAFVVFDPLKVEWRLYPGNENTRMSILPPDTASSSSTAPRWGATKGGPAVDSSNRYRIPKTRALGRRRTAAPLSVPEVASPSASASDDLSAAAQSLDLLVPEDIRALVEADEVSPSASGAPDAWIAGDVIDHAPSDEESRPSASSAAAVPMDSGVAGADFADACDDPFLMEDSIVAVPDAGQSSQLPHPATGEDGRGAPDGNTAGASGEEALAADADGATAAAADADAECSVAASVDADADGADAGQLAADNTPAGTEGDSDPVAAPSDVNSTSAAAAVVPDTGAAGEADSKIPYDTDQGEALPPLRSTRVRLTVDNDRFQDVVLEPCFLTRRWSEAMSAGMDPSDSSSHWSTQQVVSPADARLKRKRVVLLLLKSFVRYGAPLVEGADQEIAYRSQSQLGAVLSDFAIGRGESGDLCLSEVMSVSRSHCMLELRWPPDGASAQLVAYDDGSLGGTQLNGQKLGVGQHNAQPISEGDVLLLSGDVTVKLQAVSRVLHLDDPNSLAEFFEYVGERRTAVSLRSEPCQTEWIVSSSIRLSSSNNFMPRRRTEGFRRSEFSRRQVAFASSLDFNF